MVNSFSHSVLLLCISKMKLDEPSELLMLKIVINSIFIEAKDTHISRYIVLHDTQTSSLG